MNAASRPLDLPDASRRMQLLQLLADGEFHAGEALAKQLGVTRAAVWKLITALREQGINIESHARHGYHFPHAIQLYDAKRIAALLPADLQQRLRRIDTMLMVDSTNQYVLEHPADQTSPAVLCVAEMQSAGRGRRGRSWLAPFGSGVCLSLGYWFDAVPNGFSALSLVVGVALIRALRSLGVTGAQLKWPNDVLWQRRKLAGVLVEMRGEAAGPTHVVIGIGCNLRIPAPTREQLVATQTGVADLYEVLGEQLPDRNLLVATISAELLRCLASFSREGFVAFIHEWQQHDALRNVEVNVLRAEQTVSGLARGISEDGSLLVETPHGIQRFSSAEVSLRAGVS